MLFMTRFGHKLNYVINTFVKRTPGVKLSWRIFINLETLVPDGSRWYEPPHDKTNRISCAPSKDSDQSGHPPSLFRAFAVSMKKAVSLATYWAHSIGSDQTGRLWVFAGRTVILLVLSLGSSYVYGPVRLCWLWAHQRFIKMELTGFKASREIYMVLFDLRKLILQTGMRSHPVRLDVWFLVGPIIYFHTLWVRTAKGLASLCGCAGSPEPSLDACVIKYHNLMSWLIYMFSMLTLRWISLRTSYTMRAKQLLCI